MYAECGGRGHKETQQTSSNVPANDELCCGADRSGGDLKYSDPGDAEASLPVEGRGQFIVSVNANLSSQDKLRSTLVFSSDWDCARQKINHTLSLRLQFPPSPKHFTFLHKCPSDEMKQISG